MIDQYAKTLIKGTIVFCKNNNAFVKEKGFYIIESIGVSKYVSVGKHFKLKPLMEISDSGLVRIPIRFCDAMEKIPISLFKILNA